MSQQLFFRSKSRKILIKLQISLLSGQLFFQNALIFIFSFGSKKSYNSNQKQMKQSAMIVSMTGFVNDPQQQTYKKAMTSLSIRLAPSLSEQTKVLIVNDVTTEKYKIAKTYEVPISCVSIDWLLESSKKNKILPTTGFQIKKLFQGAHIVLVGLDPQKSQKLQSKIKENGGVAKSIKNNNELVSLNNGDERISTILTTKQNFIKLKPYIEMVTIPVVDIEWFDDSLRNKFCKYPYDYALNQCLINSLRKPVDHYPKMNKKLEAQLSIAPTNKQINLMLQDCLIYINSNISGQLPGLLKKLITAYGGFYIDEMSPALTHILTDPITQQEFLDLKLFGTMTNIVRMEWLMDSIYINRKMKEEDYFIRAYKLKLGSTLHLEERPNNMNYNSMTFSSLGTFGMSMPALNNRKSISAISKPNQSNLKQKQVRIIKKFQSTIFKDCNFYIDSTQKKDIELCDLTNKITRNGGHIYTSRAEIKKGHCFYVMKDSAQAYNMIGRLKKDTRGQCQIQPVSYRWVNECLNKTQFIDLIKRQSYIYKPFNFKTPILGFHKMVFEVLGLDDFVRMRLKQLYNALGSAKNVANKSEITHCLCGTNYKETPKYKQIKKQNPKIKYISSKWLLQCTKNGKIVDFEQFLMQKENILSTQQSQNSNLANTNGNQCLPVPVA